MEDNRKKLLNLIGSGVYIPDEVVNKDLTCGSKIIYGIVHKIKVYDLPMDGLEDLLNIKSATRRKYLEELKNAGLISINKTKSGLLKVEDNYGR